MGSMIFTNHNTHGLAIFAYHEKHKIIIAYMAMSGNMD